MKKILLTLTVSACIVGAGLMVFNRAIAPTSQSVVNPAEIDNGTVPARSSGY
jgi:hypothetical protein